MVRLVVCKKRKKERKTCNFQMLQKLLPVLTHDLDCCVGTWREGLGGGGVGGQEETIQESYFSPPQVVEEQWNVQSQSYPFSRTEKHQAEEAMDGIFGDHKLKGGGGGEERVRKSIYINLPLGHQEPSARNREDDLHIRVKLVFLSTGRNPLNLQFWRKLCIFNRILCPRIFWNHLLVCFSQS